MEQKFEKDVSEHSNKIVNELQEDQDKMHEWMGKLKPKLLEIAS